MVFYITFLRAIAACFITNAHYTGIYPTDLIANGGLIGDILFFAVSGYCLFNVKASFPRWYGKRLYRVYPPVIIITVVFILIGVYSLESQPLYWWLIYPTYYHFVASIIVLYIPFYFVMRIDWLRNHIPHIMAIILAVWAVVYFLFYDKSYYHIDNVREPMIRLLFFESMLLGAWFRKNDAQLRNNFKIRYVIGVIISFIIYFISKMMFSKYDGISLYQCVNQIIIFILLFFIFRVFAALDGKLEKLPLWIKKVVSVISKLTLEIYVVQYVLIAWLRDFAFFPVNWIVLTAVIFVSALVLNKVCSLFYLLCGKMCTSISARKNKS